MVLKVPEVKKDIRQQNYIAAIERGELRSQKYAVGQGELFLTKTTCIFCCFSVTGYVK